MNMLNAAPLSTSVGSYSIRRAEPGDAPAAVDFFHPVRSESPYLLLEPNEGIQEVEEQRHQFSSMNSTQVQAVFFAFYRNRPIGFAGVSRGRFSRNRHVATMAIAVEASHQRRGVGGCLTRSATTWAQTEGIKRLELTVATENVGAIGLYRAHKFTEEGTKKMSFRLGERLVDELLMARIL